MSSSRLVGFVVSALALCLAPLSAQDFADNFDREDGPPAGWFTFQGNVAISNNELLLESSGQEVWTWMDRPEPFADDLTIQFEVAFDPADTTPEVGRHGGIMFFASNRTWRYDGLNGYIIDWIDRTTDHGYRFHKWTAGAEAPIVPDGSFRDRRDPGRVWKITVEGTMIRFEVDGEFLVEFEDGEYRSGEIGLWGWSNGQHMHVDNVVVGEEVPEVEIVAEPLVGPVPLEVRFDGTRSRSPFGEIADYSWDFGDGEQGEGAVATHTYPEIGLYRVRLVITDAEGVSASDTELVTARCAGGDVSPWTSTDIGGSLLPGCARSEGKGCFELTSGGTGLVGTADGLHFLHRELNGDVTISARVDSAVADAGFQFGVMLRTSLEPGSPHAFAGIQNSTTLGVVPVSAYRPATNGPTRTRSATVALEPPAAYVQLQRRGAEFTARYSTDGATWTDIRIFTLDEAPPETMLAGLAVTSRDSLRAGNNASAVFCDLDFGDRPPGPRFARGDPTADGDINLTDGIAVLNYLFLGSEEPPCLDAGDFDDFGNDQLTISDAIGIFSWLFTGGASPPEPTPSATMYVPGDCDLDPTPDDGIGCVQPATVCP
jgi:PKD repeat protein